MKKMKTKKNSNITLIKTNSKHTDFIALVNDLDVELAERDGDLHAFYHQYNAIDHLEHVILALNGNEAVGCGAFKPHNDQCVEIKRMFVPISLRGQGIASRILRALENWAKDIGYQFTILETGKGQPEAIGLYLKKGYHITENYGQYKGIENSVCFKKELID